jgi:hypothetical protein
VFSQLPEDVKMTKQKNKKEQFWDKLPEEFKRKEYLQIAKGLGISESTAKRYLNDFGNTNLVTHDQHDTYKKVHLTNIKIKPDN